MKSRVLLLQLMQNCFPTLPNPLEAKGAEEASAAAGPSTSCSGESLRDSTRAVYELYTHLCHSKITVFKFFTTTLTKGSLDLKHNQQKKCVTPVVPNLF